MIDEDATVIIAGQYNLNRWHKYKGAVTWEPHSVYFRHEVFRSRWKATGRYTSMYAAMHGDVLLLGGSLDDIRRVIREVKG